MLRFVLERFVLLFGQVVILVAFALLRDLPRWLPVDISFGVSPLIGLELGLVLPCTLIHVLDLLLLLPLFGWCSTLRYFKRSVCCALRSSLQPYDEQTKLTGSSSRRCVGVRLPWPALASGVDAKPWSLERSPRRFCLPRGLVYSTRGLHSSGIDIRFAQPRRGSALEARLVHRR